MRLAVEITTCAPLRTGIGYYTEHVVDALLDTQSPGDDLVLLTNREPAPELAERWAPLIHRSGPDIRAAWMQIAAPHLLAASKADVALFPNYAVPLASPCPTIAVVHDLSVLHMPHHSTLQKRLLMEPMLRQVSKTASVIATVSAASQRDIIERLGVRAERTAILPGAAHPSCNPASPGTVATVRARYGLSRPYILTVGTLEPRKDLGTLLRAYDRLRREGEARELVVVGGRGWKDEGLVRALEERKESGVRWLGYVGEGDLAALYTGADLFVWTPILEGFGLPVLEAMACGAPVLASDIAALREVGGDVARYVAAADDAAFARAIRGLLDDPMALRALAAGGPVRARCFSWQATAEAVWARARVTGPTRRRSAFSAPSGEGVAPASGVQFSRAPARSLPAPLDPPPPLLKPDEWALLAAVVYADMFDSPLPLDHAQAAAMGVPLDEATIRTMAMGPSLRPFVVLSRDGYLALAGREALIDEMPARAERTRMLLGAYGRTLVMLSELPFVRGLVFSGGVAHRNVTARADIDLFVLAAAGRAYTAYTMLFLATTLTRTRRIICPNYIVDEQELTISYHRDIFTAHQLVSGRAFSGHPAYTALCTANEEWVRQLFPNFAVRPDIGVRKPSRLQGALEAALSPVAATLEASVRWAWRFRLRRRAASAPRADVVLGDGILKLHLSDYRARVLTRFAARLDSLRAQLAESRPRAASTTKEAGC